MAEETNWQGPQASLISTARNILGPVLTRRINGYLGRGGFDEVALVHEVIHGRRGVMIDVGAHHGGVTRLFAASGWQVIAFEPDDKNRAVFKKSVPCTRRITLRTEAVSDKGGQELAFYGSDVSTGISSLAAFHESHVQRQTVITTTIADVMREAGLTRLDFLKVDTEGFDLFVLKGIDWSIPPSVIVCEFEDRKTLPLGYSVMDLHAYLAEAGYKISISEWYPIERYGIEHRWRRFTDDPSSIAPDGWGNIIAYRDSRDGALGCDSLSRMAARFFREPKKTA